MWPGAIAAGIAFSLLQYFGSGIVRRITDNAGDTYGQFALVLGLVTWLGFLAISALMAAELNAALVRRRPDASCDRKAVTRCWDGGHMAYPGGDDC